jgi:cytochrome c551
MLRPILRRSHLVEEISVHTRALAALLLMMAFLLLAAGCGGPGAKALDKAREQEAAGDTQTTAAPTKTTDTTASTTKTTEAKKGSGGKLDPKARTMFASTCGSCHTLADAKTTGAVGPNLDELMPDEDRVRSQIDSGGGGMPPGLLSGDDADSVAAYVAAAAGSSK